MNNLPQKLFDLRKGRGLSQEELAEKLGVTRQAISKWEMGTGAPTIDNLISISDFFGVTIDSLVKDDTVTDASADISALPDGTADVVLPASETMPNLLRDEIREPKPFAKTIINILTVVFTWIFVQAIDKGVDLITLVLPTYLQNEVVKSSEYFTIFNYPRDTLNYILSNAAYLPLFLIMLMIFTRNKCLFSVPLIDRKSRAFPRIAAIYIAMFVMYIVAEVVHRVLYYFSTDLWMAVFDTSWQSVRYLIYYAILTYGVGGIFKRAKTLIAALVTIIAETSVCTYLTWLCYAANTKIIEDAARNNGFISNAILTQNYSTAAKVGSVLHVAVICTLVICHSIYVNMKKSQ